VCVGGGGERERGVKSTAREGERGRERECDTEAGRERGGESTSKKWIIDTRPRARSGPLTFSEMDQVFKDTDDMRLDLEMLRSMPGVVKVLSRITY